jgi:ABC-type nitrate/sulfonate/bicarbonate transport system substrate-binding protein
MRLFLSLVLAVIVSVAFSENAEARPAPEKIKVLVPDRGNLQYMSFWVAKSAGYFLDEGIDVELVVPPGPQQTTTFFEEHQADIAVLPPPVYVGLIASKKPVVLVANLLTNDPIELIVRRSALTARGLSADMPIKARLEGLRGIKLGVAPHPPTRLRALFASQGLDVDKDVTMVILHGKEQNAAFHAGEVDALYAHTPYLERAIINDDALVLVDQSRGEVPELANRQIHTLAVNRSLLETRRELVISMVRAIALAESLIHRKPADTVAALAHEMPDRDRKELETIVRLYEPAIPKTPAVRAADIPGALTMFPAGTPKPDLAGIDLERHVAPDLLAVEPPHTARAWAIVIGVGMVVVAALVAFTTRRRVPVSVSEETPSSKN